MAKAAQDEKVHEWTEITGKVIAFSEIEKITSTDPQKQPMLKRKLFIDCTRYDPYTGERGYENTPLLEFGGKALDKLNELIGNGLKKDDIVVVSFDIQGTKYTSKTTGKQDIFTRVMTLVSSSTGGALGLHFFPILNIVPYFLVTHNLSPMASSTMPFAAFSLCALPFCLPFTLSA